MLLLEHGRLPHQGLHDFVQRILSCSRQDDWILTELYLLHDKCIQFADVSCDCGLHVDSKWLLSSVETRCQAIEDKLNYGRVDSKWLTGWKRNVDQVMIIDNDSNAEECGEMEILFGGESVSSLSFKDSCLNYKEDEYDTPEIMLNNEDTESSILVKRRKINEESGWTLSKRFLFIIVDIFSLLIIKLWTLINGKVTNIQQTKMSSHSVFIVTGTVLQNERGESMAYLACPFHFALPLLCG